MSTAEARLRDALQRVKTIDPHCHLRPSKPAADHLADILLYHHVWVELVSAGMPAHEVSQAGLPHEVRDPGMPPDERVRRCLTWLPSIRNTTLGVMVRWILQELYGVSDLTSANLDRALAVAAARGRDPAWQEEVLRERCGIETSISVERSSEPYSVAMQRAVEDFPGNLVSGKQPSREIVAGMESQFGREIQTADDFRAFMAARVARRRTADCRFWGCWVLPCLADRPASDAEARRILAKARADELLDEDELGRFCHFGMVCLLQELSKTPLRTIQLIVGAEVLPPHRSITHWNGRFPGGLSRLAGRFPEFHFNCSTASDAFTQDLGILAKHVPNLSVAGYWWHTLYPFYIRKSLETRLDMVPVDKIVGFFSDAYHAEWCYPKLRLVKEILGDVLNDRVQRGWYTPETACDIVDKLLYENPKRIYGL